MMKIFFLEAFPLNILQNCFLCVNEQTILIVTTTKNLM